MYCCYPLQAQRKNAFRAVGRFIGLCLWFRYTVPFMVCRHVAKYLLGREVKVQSKMVCYSNSTAEYIGGVYFLLAKFVLVEW